MNIDLDKIRDNALLQQLQRKGQVSHIVGKISYGADCVLTCTYTMSDEDNEQAVQGSLGAAATWLTNSISGQMSV